MKVERLYRYTCEGCGAQRLSEDELTEFGPHERLSRWEAASHPQTEQQCIEFGEEKRRERERQEKLRTEQEEALIKACAEDDIFRKLVLVFPNEDGGGKHWKLFGHRAEELAESVAGWAGIDAIVGDCSSAYHGLLARCIQAARSAEGG